MKVKQCENGHHFDLDKFSQCPHCGAGVRSDAKTEASQEVKTSGPAKRFWPWGKKADPIEVISVEDDDPSQGTIGKVISSHSSNPPESELAPERIPSEAQPVIQATTDEVSRTPAARSIPRTELNDDDDFVVPPKQRGAETNDKTIGRFQWATQQHQPKVIEPCVGWLVCVRGELQGQYFALFAGNNSVGRKSTNRVELPDPTVSAEKHGFVLYDPQNRDFYLRPGDSSGLTYLNGQLVLDPKPLQERDIVQFGMGEYLFIPLCGPNFTWDDYLGKEQVK